MDRPAPTPPPGALTSSSAKTSPDWEFQLLPGKLTGRQLGLVPLPYHRRNACRPSTSPLRWQLRLPASPEMHAIGLRTRGGFHHGQQAPPVQLNDRGTAN